MIEENNNIYANDEIDFNKIFKIIWQKNYFISSVTIIFAVITVIFSLSLPNFYTSSALLVPSNNNDSFASGGMSGLSSIAGLAGVNLSSGDSKNKTIEAVERIQSYEFFSKHFLPYIKLENLTAVQKWDPKKNKIFYNNSFDDSSGKWSSNKVIPTTQEAYKIYRSILFLKSDKKTSFLSITLTHQSPFVAKDWLELIIKNINSTMREEEKIFLENSIGFLGEISKKNNIQSIKVAITNLMESQIQSLMLASSNEDYVYKTIDSPIVSEEKSSPTRSIICIIGTFLGFIIATLYVLISHYLKINKS